MSANPELYVEIAPGLSAHPDGYWRVPWWVENRTTFPVEIDEAWFPHGRFRGKREPQVPPTPLAISERRAFESLVQWSEPPGTEVENAFLIVRFRAEETALGATAFRLFARITVTAGADGAPHPQIVLLMTEPSAVDI